MSIADLHPVFKQLLQIVYSGYWLGVIWWCLRGQVVLRAWQTALYDFFIDTFRRTDILYLAIEHQPLDGFRIPSDRAMWRFWSLLPPERTFPGRIARFIEQYRQCFGQLGWPAHPPGHVYRLYEYAFWLSSPYWLFSLLNLRIEIELALMCILFMLAAVLFLPMVCTGVLSKAQLQLAIADCLLGDVELAEGTTAGEQ